MIAELNIDGTPVKFDLSTPIDISIPLRTGERNVNAWYVDPMTIEPVRTDQFVGSVKEGGSVNFRNIVFNPHGNGTHTECVGHIAEEVYSLNEELTKFHFHAEVVSVEPEEYIGEEQEFLKHGDLVITREMLENVLKGNPEAIIIRTLPNHIEKLNYQYSNCNWPFLLPEAADFISEKGIEHLLIDLPSVDREFDGGKMLAHRSFWNFPYKTRHGCTITEMIFVPNHVSDGVYLVNLQVASFDNDASPSKPVVYPKL